MSVTGVFISYRRQDAAGHAGRLRQDLARRYGGERVFFDVADAAPGADWASRVHQAVADCEVMLVVIGPGWLDATDASGHRRLDDPDDFIRTEVAAALREGKRVVPVLVGGATFPNEEALPSDVRPLLRRHGIELPDRHWDQGVRSLFSVLDQMLGGPFPGAPSRPPEVSHAPALPTGRATPAPRAEPLLARLARAFDVLLGRPGDTSIPGSAAPQGERAWQAAPRVAVPESVAPRGTGAAPHAVFVSHATGDRGVVDRAVRAIEARGVRCWVAYRDIPPGVPSWAEPIVTAIAGSKLVLVILTASSMQSIEVLREVTLAADEKIPLLPVCLDTTPLSPGLRYFFVAGQRLELAGKPEAEQLASIVPAVAARLPAGAAVGPAI